MIFEKLFLSKKSNEFVDEEKTIKLKQHQKAGIRFIYEQFKKKHSGVILNDPPGSGKCVQALLFLNAVKHTLPQPVLVLCNDIEHWKNLCREWMREPDDVEFGLNKLFAKKMVFINDVCDAPMCSRREWSIVVLQDNNCTLKLMKTMKNVKASFKIVITSYDLKNSLQSFATIYNWINPSNNFSIDSYVQKKDVKDAIEKSILLDCFYEGIVLRRNHVKHMLDSAQQVLLITEMEKPQKTSLKNKDNTGTKIKRTLKRVEKNPVFQTEDMSQSKKSKFTNNIVEDSSDIFPDFVTRKKSNRINGGNDYLNISVDKVDVMSLNTSDTSLKKDEVSNDNKIHNINHSLDATNNKCKSVESVCINHKPSPNKLTKKEELRENNVNKDVSEKIKSQLVTVDDSEYNICFNNLCVNSNLSHESKNLHDLLPTASVEDKLANKEQELDKTDVSTNSENNEDSEIYQLSTINMEYINEVANTELDNENIVISSHKSKVDSDIERGCNVTNDEVSKNIDVVENIKCDVRTRHKDVHCDLDDQIKDLEEKAMKKYKGTLLDSIF